MKNKLLFARILVAIMRMIKSHAHYVASQTESEKGEADKDMNKWIDTIIEDVKNIK